MVQDARADPVASELGVVSGVAAGGEDQPCGATCPDGDGYLYRGLYVRHWKYVDALQGRAVPRGGEASVGQHAARAPRSHSHALPTVQRARPANGPRSGATIADTMRARLPQRMPRRFDGSRREWNVMRKNAPEIADPHVSSGLIGLPTSIIDEFMARIVPGSGRIVG